MTLEELKEFMQDENNAAAFNEIVKAAGYETPDDIQGLKRNNQELKLEKQKIRSEYENLKKKIDEIEEQRYIEGDGQKGESKNAELEKMKRELARMTEKINTTESRASQIESEYHSTLKESILSNTLESLGFKQHKELLKSAFQGKAKVEIDGNKKIVLIDTGDGIGLPADEFFKQYSTTEQGKMYLDKPVNAGAGAHGFTGSSGSKVMSIEAFNQLPAKQRSAYVASGGEVKN